MSPISVHRPPEFLAPDGKNKRNRVVRSKDVPPRAAPAELKVCKETQLYVRTSMSRSCAAMWCSLRKIKTQLALAISDVAPRSHAVPLKCANWVGVHGHIDGVNVGEFPAPTCIIRFWRLLFPSGAAIFMFRSSVGSSSLRFLSRVHGPTVRYHADSDGTPRAAEHRRGSSLRRDGRGCDCQDQ